MEYTGEHTLIGQFGHFFIITAFVSALVAALAYYISTRNGELAGGSWRDLARGSFRTHSFAACMAIGLLFFMIANHYFEYHYVWKYSNLAMEAKYIFSCFWSGQQGSFLLWAFWIIVLGNILVFFAKEWESPVMTTVALLEAFIFSMLLGIYLFDVRIGLSPFTLIRELPENADLPWTQMPDYLQKISDFGDGTGLNPLLQNYWMTIHPPTLFLGFAATVFPFAFAIAGIWQKKYTQWVSPAIPWTIFTVMVLGAGILMGGAWAYEALSFGGFWAWDPVENASLVPWITMVGALHVMLITRKRKNAIFTSCFLAIISFLLVIYSSFLTRSGILGESSVHSFTENGMFMQLLVLMLSSLWFSFVVLMINRTYQLVYTLVSIGLFTAYCFTGNTDITLSSFFILTIGMLVTAYEKYFPKAAADEKLWSRDFWMFIGALVLLLSALQITFSTSIPVVNRVFGSTMDAFTDLGKRSQFYNTWQVPFAIIICMLMAAGQYMNYKNTNPSLYWKKIAGSIAIAAVLTLLISWAVGFYSQFNTMHAILLFAGVFAAVANSNYIIKVLKGNLDHAGGSVAHIGFALLITGALIATSQSKEISRNSSGFDVKLLNEQFNNQENILLRKGDTLRMDDYFVTYRGKTQKGINIYYEVGYYQPRWNKNTHSYQPGDSLFTLFPFVQLNEKFGNVPEPGTRHMLTRDIFTHVKWADLSVASQDGKTDDDYMGETTINFAVQDTFNYENMRIFFEKIYLVDDAEEKKAIDLQEKDIVVKARLQVSTLSGENKPYTVEPVFVVRDSTTIIPHTTTLAALDTKFRIKELGQKPNTIVLGVQEREYMVMEAIVFPYINVLWIGCLVITIGCLMSVRGYWKRRRTATHAEPKETNVETLSYESSVSR